MSQFRFEMQEDNTLEKAMSYARVLFCDDENFQKRKWKGFAIQEISRYYVDSHRYVDGCLKEQEKAVRLKRDSLEKDDRKLTPKEESRIRQRVRESWKKRREIIEKKEYSALVSDEDRLYKALLLVGTEYLCDCHKRGVERDDFTVFEPDNVQTAIMRWSNRGGFLLRVRGDARTLTVDNKRPKYFLHIKDDINFEIHRYYADLFDDLKNPEIEIAEIIPTNGATWDPPMICKSRLKLKE